ncbi:hypothetical protein [Chishuiella changwenlii]|uniref:hypothetical protein n=1 Tax=Chishuiella changwenlii TaxID=1434701 RepID=UPI002FD89B48
MIKGLANNQAKETVAGAELCLSAIVSKTVKTFFPFSSKYFLIPAPLVVFSKSASVFVFSS